MWTYRYRSHSSNISDNLITIWANIVVIMGLVRWKWASNGYQVCVCVCDVKIGQHQTILSRVKIWLKSKKITLLRCVADVVVDKDVLQSLSRFFCPKTTFPLVRKGKNVLPKQQQQQQGHMARNDFWCRKWNIVRHMCVGIMGKKETGTHTHTHPRAPAPNLFHVICFVSFRTVGILGKHSAHNIQLWVLHVSLCCETKVANIPGDAEQAVEAYNV